MVHGDVSYNHHHGHQNGADWAAKVELTKEGGAVKMAHHHIVVDFATRVSVVWRTY